MFKIVLRRVHRDVCEIPVHSMGGSCYLVTLLGDCLSFAVLLLIGTMDLVPKAMKEMLISMELRQATMCVNYSQIVGKSTAMYSYTNVSCNVRDEEHKNPSSIHHDAV